MLDALIKFAVSTQEYRAGIASVTMLGFVMSLVLTLWPQVPALRKQLGTMHTAVSLDGVSGVMFILTFTYNIVFFIYALQIKMAGGLFNAIVLGPLYYLLLAEYARRAEIPRWEKLVGCVCVAIICVAVVSPSAAIAYKAVSLCCLVGVWSQSVTMWWNGTSVGTNPIFLKWYAVVCFVWAIYSAAIRETFMAWYALGLAAGFATAFVLCYRLRPRAV